MTGMSQLLRIGPLILLLCFLVLGNRGNAFAQGQGQCSAYDPDIEWLESVYDQYSICYTAQYTDDVEFVSGIIEDAKQLMKDKYQSDTLRDGNTRTLHVNIMLVPEPNHEATVSSTRFKCCYDSSGRLSSRGQFAQIPYLAPGHSDWRASPTFGRARQTPDNFHAKTITHEFVHAIQRTVWRASQNVPQWFSEGQAEYDGMFHTTEYNRTIAFRNLVDLVYRRHRDDILLGQTLASDETTLVVADIYGSANIVLKYLSGRLGEGFQLRLMKHSEPTFNEALTAEIETAGTSMQAEFAGLRDWLDRCYANSHDCDVERIAASGEAGAADDVDSPNADPDEDRGTGGGDVEPDPPSKPSVSLSLAQPQVGVSLTAMVSDPETGISSANWKWESSADGTTGWSLVAIGGGLSSTYTPSEPDAGKRLRATATYRTSDGHTKRASAISDLQVVNE